MIAKQRSCLVSDLLVEHVISKSRSGPLPLGDQAGDLLDGVHLLVKELALEEVAKMSVTVGSLVHVKEALVDCLLKFKSSLKSVTGLPHSMALGLAMSWK